MSTLLITFGCSWTYGAGAGYQPGMDSEEYERIKLDPDTCYQYSFRGLLCAKYGLDHKNFAIAGSSNQTQFRLAEEFFGSHRFRYYQSRYDKIIVLWGITSTLRNDAYFFMEGRNRSYFYSAADVLAKTMLRSHYSHNNEIVMLSNKIRFWNKFFANENVSVLWFDTFNHHKYSELFEDATLNQCDKFTQLKDSSARGFDQLDHEACYDKNKDQLLCNFIDQDKKLDNFLMFDSEHRDLLSTMASKNGMAEFDRKYHRSTYENDSNRVDYLVKKGLLNPLSFHPTQQGHQQIYDIFVDKYFSTLA